MRPVQTEAHARAQHGELVASRLLGFLGLAVEKLALAGQPEPGLPDLPGRAPDGSDDAPSDPAVDSERTKRPVTIGAPIHQALADDVLRSSSRDTQSRLSADGGTIGSLTVRAASMSGRRHASKGYGREDAFAFLPLIDDGLVIAVADGIGDASARFAAVGAEVAARMSCYQVSRLVGAGNSIEPRAFCRKLASVMMTEAERFVGSDFDDRDLATTLITVWFTRSGSYHGLMVGDGAVFTLTAGRVSPVTPAPSGTFGRASALPSAYSQVEAFSGQLGRGSALLAATDGLSDPMRSGDVATAIGRTWQRPPTVLDFLYDLSFERRGEADDRTGVCVWFGADRPVR
jgi:serine/threonine protein phosphatase PrpC